MRIVIDTNALSPVFNKNNNQHSEYKPVLKCILDNKAIMVYGGSTYEIELKRLSRIRGVVIQLWNAGKVDILGAVEVDSEEKRLQKLVKTKQFNDHHIVAIVIVGKCKIICSEEKKALRFFTQKKLYPKHVKVPKIYRRANHVHLLPR